VDVLVSVAAGTPFPWEPCDSACDELYVRLIGQCIRSASVDVADVCMFKTKRLN